VLKVIQTITHTHGLLAPSSSDIIKLFLGDSISLVF